MDWRDAGELVLVVLSITIFVGYHVWLYALQGILQKRNKSSWFNVYKTADLSRLLWTHAMVSDEKEAITGVQTLRNAIMVCAMLATASAYVGGRALPSMLFDASWRDTLEKIAAVDPLTGGTGRKPLVPATIKASVCLGLVFASFICFAQAARYYVHLGFLFKVPPTRHNTTGWHPEGEALALVHQAGICFSLALRFFYAFGLAALYIPGPTSLICSSVFIVVILFLTDNLQVYQYDDLLLKIRRMKPLLRPRASPADRSDVYKAPGSAPDSVLQ
jgi:hypothetical protein